MTDRPTIAAPIIENIPAELRQRTQWVCWAYEWRVNKQDVGKWTKVPYTPGTTSKAMPNKKATWRSFEDAHTCYLGNPQFFAGIGYMFSPDDPYVGGDRDNDLSMEGIPHTYAEISPSGGGVKFIARAQGHYGRHTAKGELYSSTRFFTITGRVISGHTLINPCQEAVDLFHASLGSAGRPIRAGVPGDGSRAAAAAAIPETDWADGRRLLKDKLNWLLGKAHASAISKTSGKETQLYYVLQEDYHGLHVRWPGAGVVRGDGSIDSSQIRAIFANGIRMRNFTFPQFIALFYHFYGAECLAKWGTTQAFREEAAMLWARARTPRAAEAHAPEIVPAPRGRAGNHATLLEHTYQILQNYRAGASAIVNLADVAADLGVHKSTAQRAIKELVGGKITTEKHGQYGGLIVHFLPELIYEEETNPILPHTNGVNGHTRDDIKSAGRLICSELIYSGGDNGNMPAPALEIPHAPQSANDETGNDVPELIYEENANAELGSTDVRNSMGVLSEERECEAPYIENTYITSPVSLLPPMINSEKCTLDFAVAAALAALPKSRANERTGELKKWPITKRRVIEFVQYEYAERGWKAPAIGASLRKVRARRKAQTFDDLKALKRDALEKKHGSAQKEIARYERQAATDSNPDLRKWWAGRAAQKRGQLALLAYEIGRRDALDAARIATEGYSQGEQQEMLELAAREYKPSAQAPRVSLPDQPSIAAGLIDRLKARQLGETQEGLSYGS